VVTPEEANGYIPSHEHEPDPNVVEICQLRDEIKRLRAIITSPGGCMNCGDFDPFRVGKWGQGTADVFEEADPLSMTPDSMMTEKEGEE